MDTLEFLHAIWPLSGLYCLAVRRLDGSYVHQIFETIPAAVAAATNLATTQNVFFTIHTLSARKVWDPNKKNPKTGELGGWRVRTQENTRAAKCFFLDLDVEVGNPKKYDSQEVAVVDLRAFCKAAGLPKPLVTSSGGGLHVYWLMDQEIASTEWVQIAEKLKATAKAHGLRFDPARTTDRASVLRVAGTFNLKDPANPRPVQVLTDGEVTTRAAFEDRLDRAIIRAGADLPAPKVASILGSNMTREFEGPAPTMASLMTACGQIRAMAKAPEAVSEPQWYAAIQVIRWVENGYKFAHKFSQRYPGYSEVETDNKLAQLEQKDIKPTLCSRMAEVSDASICEQCKFWNHARVRSPITAARFKDEAPARVLALPAQIADAPEPIILPPPPGFKQMRDGSIVRVTKNKDDDEIEYKIFDYELYPVELTHADSLDSMHSAWHVNIPHRGTIAFHLNVSHLYDSRLFRQEISRVGVLPDPEHTEDLQHYMTAYIRQLQKATASSTQYSHLGWTEDMAGFILPDRVITTKGVKPVKLSDAAAIASRHVKKAGTLEAQVELMQFYNSPMYLRNQFYILGSLAAPLFYMTNQFGVVMHATGTPGASKSTSLYAAVSFWGHPTQYPINGTADGATAKGRNERISTLSNLPIGIDEIMKLKEGLRDLVMGVTQPGRKITLTADRKERKTADNVKSTILLSTANESLHSILSAESATNTAGSVRIFEILFPKSSPAVKPAADIFLNGLHENYGHIGEAFLQYVLPRQEEIKQRVQKMVAWFDQAAYIEPSERFWSALMATVQVAGEIAVELGLLPFDMQAIQHWLLVEQVPIMRGIIKQEYSSPAMLLAGYLEHIDQHILVVNKNLTSGNITCTLKKPHGQLLGRLETDIGKVWISKSEFRDFCFKTSSSMHAITAPLVAAGIIHDVSARKVLGAGCPEYEKAQTMCLMINLRHPEISGAVKVDYSGAIPEDKEHRVISVIK